MEAIVKKLSPDAVLPKKARDDDAGYDLVAIDDGTVSKDGYIEYKTGLSLQPPPGYHTNIYPRSSISNYDLILANSVGLVDNGYRGELLVRFKISVGVRQNDDKSLSVKTPYPMKRYKKGDRIAQLVFVETVKVSIVEADELSESSRGAGGFGSTGL